MKIRFLAHSALMAVLLAAGGCSRHVARVSPDQRIDLSGRWNDVDSREAADAIIQQNIQAGGGQSWASRYLQTSGGRRPILIVGSVRNRTMEHLPINAFVRDLERAFVNSGQVEVVADAEERGEVREERMDQQENAAAETRVRMGREHGARYMLQGDIESIEDREGRRRVVYYQIDMTLLDMETNSREWIGQHRIKKYVENARGRL
jgi:penicillin-binding protein activator